MQAVNSSTAYCQHSVAPGTLRGSFHISVGQITATHKAHTAIHNNHLAMVTIVEPVAQDGEPHLQECLYLPARKTYLLEKTARHTPTAHAVVYHAHLNPLTRFCYKSIAHTGTQLIILKYIELQVNMLPCCGYGR